MSPIVLAELPSRARLHAAVRLVEQGAHPAGCMPEATLPVFLQLCAASVLLAGHLSPDPLPAPVGYRPAPSPDHPSLVVLAAPPVRVGSWQTVLTFTLDLGPGRARPDEPEGLVVSRRRARAQDLALPGYLPPGDPEGVLGNPFARAGHAARRPRAAPRRVPRPSLWARLIPRAAFGGRDPRVHAATLALRPLLASLYNDPLLTPETLPALAQLLGPGPLRTAARIRLLAHPVRHVRLHALQTLRDMPAPGDEPPAPGPLGVPAVPTVHAAAR